MTPLSLEEREAIYMMRWKRKPGPLTVLPPVLPWERPVYVKVAPKPRPTREVAVRRRVIAEPNDTSPAHIRKIRAAFCDEFVKTGNINVQLQQKLKDYANECRTTPKHSSRVSAQHASDRGGRATTFAGDDGHRDIMQVDGAAAERIADFLRS